jgi:hypothetical protein
VAKLAQISCPSLDMMMKNLNDQLAARSFPVFSLDKGCYTGALFGGGQVAIEFVRPT